MLKYRNKEAKFLKSIGVVLAGGLSSRMHKDKSQLVWRGKSFIEHSYELLIEAGCVDVIVSNNDNVKCIKDRYPNCGPLAGIDACLNYIQNNIPDAEAMLIMPVDMPLMSVQLLRDLQQQATVGSAVFYNLGRFPMILPVNNKLARQLQNTLQQNQTGSSISIRQLLTKLDCQVLNIDQNQQSAFFNCNTAEQWQNLISLDNLH